MASVLVLQVMHDYSDAEAADAARCDLRWKATCGFPLDHGGFDPSTLVLSGGVAAQFLADQAAGGPACEWYGDTAYGTGDLRAAVHGAGHAAVIKPGPLEPAVEGGFTVDDFTVDEPAGTVTCPAGLSRSITARRSATFGAACRGCPLRPRCTAAKDGRSLRLHPQDAILRAARASWAAQPALREDYRKYRPNVERVISQVASRGGRRLKLRYLGAARNNAWLKNRTAALNLRTLISRAWPTRTEHGYSPERPPPRRHQAACGHPGQPGRLAAGGKTDHVASPARAWLTAA
jgi:hypothetical protein